MIFSLSDHLSLNKPIVTNGKPEIARYCYFDNELYIYRPFRSLQEVKSYYTTQISRKFLPAVLVNTGGTIVNGNIVGGVNEEYWWKDDTTDDGLVLKNSSSGDNIQIEELREDLVSLTTRVELLEEETGNGNLTEFKYLTVPEDGIVHVDGTMRKVVIEQDVILDALNMPPGMHGVLIVKVDDLGGKKFTFAPGNTGTPILNTLPRAQTRLYWERYDDSVFWKTEVLFGGTEPTSIPTIAIDNYKFTLEVFHVLPDSEILMSVDNGPWVQYTGRFNIPQINRLEGYWRFKVKGLEPDRIESLIAYSLPVRDYRIGFPYTLPLTLS